jgi:hypothetical protein
VESRVPVPIRRSILKTVLAGLCALVIAAPAAAQVVAHPRQPGNRLQAQAASQRTLIRHDRQVIRFFRHHRWMLARYNAYRRAATRDLRIHRAELSAANRGLHATLRTLAARQHRLGSARIHATSPTDAIRQAFGPRYWREAISVARCESGLVVGAQNGQYLGLFQMGSSERSIYGHGSSAWAQARAASRYFVASGRDWSPWSCKPQAVPIRLQP